MPLPRQACDCQENQEIACDAHFLSPHGNGAALGLEFKITQWPNLITPKTKFLFEVACRQGQEYGKRC